MILCPEYKTLIKELGNLPENDERQIAAAKIWAAIYGFLPHIKDDYKDRLSMYIYEQIKDDLK